MLKSIFTFVKSMKIRKKESKPGNIFKQAFGKYLLLTNTLSSGIPLFLGDLIQQELEYQQHKLPKRYDFQRLARMLTVGLVLGPYHHFYYIGLNKWIPGKSFSSITKKILLDQFFMGPSCISLFFLGMGLLEGKTLAQSTEKLKKKFLEVYIVDWCIWPPAMVLNFYYIPIKFQVIYINGVTLLYDIFLSYVEHRERAREHRKMYQASLENSL